MPRTKKPAGTAVDSRNGRASVLGPAVSLERFPLPVKAADARTRKVWAALWDDPVCSILSPVDREVVVRWVHGVDAYVKALAEADSDPVTTGSMGQEVPSPWFAIAKQHLGVAEECERQIGIGALNRARLGLTFAQAAKSMADVNADYVSGGGDDDEPDPRVIRGAVER